MEARKEDHMRNLILLETNNGTYAQFIKYVQGRPTQTKKLLREKEIVKAKEVLKSGNAAEIDLFCYSIC